MLRIRGRVKLSSRDEVDAVLPAWLAYGTIFKNKSVKTFTKQSDALLAFRADARTVG